METLSLYGLILWQALCLGDRICTETVTEFVEVFVEAQVGFPKERSDVDQGQMEINTKKPIGSSKKILINTMGELS